MNFLIWNWVLADAWEESLSGEWAGQLPDSLTMSQFCSSLFMVKFMLPFIRNLKEDLKIFLYTLSAICLEEQQWEKCGHSLCGLWTPCRRRHYDTKYWWRESGPGVGSYMCEGAVGTAGGQWGGAWDPWLGRETWNPKLLLSSVGKYPAPQLDPTCQVEKWHWWGRLLPHADERNSVWKLWEWITSFLLAGIDCGLQGLGFNRDWLRSC